MEDQGQQSLSAQASTWTCNVCSQVFQSLDEFVSHGETFHSENHYSICIMCESVIVSEKQLNENVDEQPSPSASDHGFCTIDQKSLMDVCNTESTTLSTVTSHGQGFQETARDDSTNQTNETGAKLSLCNTCYEMLPVLNSSVSCEAKYNENAETLVSNQYKSADVQPPMSSFENTKSTEVESEERKPMNLLIWRKLPISLSPKNIQLMQ